MSFRTALFAFALFLPAPAMAGVVTAPADSPASPPAEPLKASPITPGFWAWPPEKATTPEAIKEACREILALQFADGRYFGLTFREGKPAFLSEAGTCSFDVGTQVERCTVRLTLEDGDPYESVVDSHFSFESDGTLRMRVDSEITTGPDKGSKGTVDVYPVKCPDDITWKLILGR